MDAERRCKTCRYWTEYSLWGECQRLGGNMGGPDHEGSKAYAQDAGNRVAFFRTQGDFGCLEHKAKS